MLLDYTAEWLGLLDFVLRHRKNKVFKDYSAEDILSTLYDSHKANGLGVIKHNGITTAICASFPSADGCSIHINQVLTTQPDDIVYLLSIYHNRFPGWTITARRRGHFVKYNTAKLIRRLCLTNAKALVQGWERF